MPITRNGKYAFDNKLNSEIPNQESNEDHIKKSIQIHQSNINVNKFNHRPSSSLSSLLNDQPPQDLPNDINGLPPFKLNMNLSTNNDNYSSYSNTYINDHHHHRHSPDPNDVPNYRNFPNPVYNSHHQMQNEYEIPPSLGSYIPLHFAPFILPTSTHSQNIPSYPSFSNHSPHHAYSPSQTSHPLLNSSILSDNSELESNYRPKSRSILDYLDAAASHDDATLLNKMIPENEPLGYMVYPYYSTSIKQNQDYTSPMPNATSGHSRPNGSFIGSPISNLKPTVKMACNACIRGHRAPSCKHFDRTLFVVRPRGRPSALCHKCLEKSSSCRCQAAKPPSMTAMYPEVNRSNNLRAISSKNTGVLNTPIISPTSRQNKYSPDIVEQQQEYNSSINPLAKQSMWNNVESSDYKS